MPPSRSRVAAPRVIAAAVVLLAAACSGDNKTATTTTVPPSTLAPAPVTSSTAPPAVPAKFRFGFVAPAAALLIPLAYAQENALSLAVSDINDAGGVLGAPTEAITTDDMAAGSAAAAVTDLVQSGASVVLGPVGSTDALAAIPAVEAAGTAACSASATLPHLNSDPPAAPFYRTALPDQYTVDFMGQQIVARRDAAAPAEPWKVAIVARGDDYGLTVSSGLSALLTSKGMVTTIINYLPGQTSLGGEAAQAAAFAPNTVVVVTYNEAPRLLDQLVNAGVPATAIMGFEGLFTPSLAERTFSGAPEKLDGLTMVGVTGDRAFLQRLQALPSGQVIYGAQMYDCAIVMALAAESAQSADPAAYGAKITAVLTGARPCSTYGDCRARLAAGDTVAYQGQIGPFTFDATNSPTASRFTVANLANGAVVVAQTVDVDLADQRAAAASELAMAAALQTARLQQALSALGLYSGPIDGVPSEALTASIGALQQRLGVPVTGVYDEATDAAARAQLGLTQTSISEATASLQQALADLGLYSGPIDGVYSAATVAAVRSLQASLGVPQTGIVDAATVQAVYARGAASAPPPTEPPTTVPPTKPPTATTTVPSTPAPTSPPTAEPTTAAPPPATTVPKPETTVAPTTPTTTETPEPDPDIVSVLHADGRFTTYLGLLDAAGMTDALEILGPVTVFAPTDAAFAAMPPGALETVRSDPERLRELLLGAMARGRLSQTDLGSGEPVTSLSDTTLAIGTAGGSVTVNSAPLLTPALDAANGIIHPTSAVPT